MAYKHPKDTLLSPSEIAELEDKELNLQHTGGLGCGDPPTKKDIKYYPDFLDAYDYEEVPAKTLKKQIKWKL